MLFVSTFNFHMVINLISDLGIRRMPILVSSLSNAKVWTNNFYIGVITKLFRILKLPNVLQLYYSDVAFSRRLVMVTNQSNC